MQDSALTKNGRSVSCKRSVTLDLVQFALIVVSKDPNWAQVTILMPLSAAHFARDRANIMGCLVLLRLEMVLDVGQVDLLIGHVIRHAQILHVLAAEHSQIIQVLWHVCDRFTDLAQTKRHLEIVVTALIPARQLALT